ncbi:hypothetical protein MNV_1190016 [Candidatus Methanoperedens nitroreducens]|uniref:Uncharacterized protein n=1 Tax=Candidatus Methanoperedens nitratireducens TaxID=1392998 RepID=A0A284VJK0_9EURY|nr:hypothetical protein MNV_1190016 [Candidatus Methanoperedens nitroreducens]
MHFIQSTIYRKRNTFQVNKEHAEDSIFLHPGITIPSYTKKTILTKSILDMDSPKPGGGLPYWNPSSRSGTSQKFSFQEEQK